MKDSVIITSMFVVSIIPVYITKSMMQPATKNGFRPYLSEIKGSQSSVILQPRKYALDMKLSFHLGSQIASSLYTQLCKDDGSSQSIE